jgi:Flp pilus assembly protein TadD
VDGGRRNEGIARLKVIAGREPDNLEAHLALAHAYALTGRTDEARAERRTAIRIRTNTVAAQ